MTSSNGLWFHTAFTVSNGRISGASIVPQVEIYIYITFLTFSRAHSWVISGLIAVRPSGWSASSGYPDSFISALFWRHSPSDTNPINYQFASLTTLIWVGVGLGSAVSVVGFHMCGTCSSICPGMRQSRITAGNEGESDPIWKHNLVCWV